MRMVVYELLVGFAGLRLLCVPPSVYVLRLRGGQLVQVTASEGPQPKT